jgi:hypothetical protein
MAIYIFNNVILFQFLLKYLVYTEKFYKNLRPTYISKETNNIKF